MNTTARTEEKNTMPPDPSAPVSLTIDSSVALKMSDFEVGGAGGEAWMQALRDLEARNLITFAPTATLIHDKEADRDKDRVTRDYSWARSQGMMPVPARLDESFLDSDAYFDEDTGVTRKLEAIALRGREFTGDAKKDRAALHDQRDGDHLIAHLNSGREFFLTRDEKYFLKPLVRKAIFEVSGVRLISKQDVVDVQNKNTAEEVRAHLLAASTP